MTPDLGVFAGIGDAPTNQVIATLTVQFQSPPRVEVSTGVMVPLMPYHSYSTAGVASNGVITNYVVQETLTYTVVPVVLVNPLIYEFPARRQRSALFGSAAVGYNPATSAVEFGAGLSFSWGSIVLSFMADIGRDTHLTGGFTVGEKFPPTGNPPKPLTSTFWGVKPAISLSIRLPLGGAGK